MSVVAGCSLFDGVLLAADCRVTIQRQQVPDVHLDCAQKIFPLTPNTVLGFVGDVGAASLLIREMWRQLRKRKRQDAISLAAWLPRFFRSAYGQSQAKLGSKQIAFMVASVIRDRPNAVEREAVVKLVNHIGFGASAFKRNWMPDILVRILQTDPKYKFIRIPGTSMGMLYVMESPLFEPQSVPPLNFAAIGSGGGSMVKIADYHDMIVAGEPGNAFIESTFLRDAINDFLAESKLASVGGLLPIVKVTGNGVEALGFGFEMPDEGIKIGLGFDQSDNRWIQRNSTTGKEMPLLYPWEIPLTQTKSKTFNDFLDAQRQFRGRT